MGRPKRKRDEVEAERADDDSSDVAEGEYEVDRIVASRRDKDGECFYLIKWKGQPESENTWEPLEHLNCVDLLRDFESRRRGRGAARASDSARAGAAAAAIESLEDLADIQAVGRIDGELVYRVGSRSGRKHHHVSAATLRLCAPEKVVGFLAARLKVPGSVYKGAVAPAKAAEGGEIVGLRQRTKKGYLLDIAPPDGGRPIAVALDALAEVDPLRVIAFLESIVEFQ